MMYRKNTSLPVVLSAAVIMAFLSNTAVATEQNIPVVEPIWAFDSNIAPSHLVPPPSGVDLFGIHTIGVALDSHEQIYTAMWGTVLPTYLDPEVVMYGHLVDHGQQTSHCASFPPAHKEKPAVH